MQAVDLRLDAGWIVPIEPAGALAGHALLVDGGRIVALAADGGRRSRILGARARRAAAPRAAARARQRAHARGDEPVPRNRRRRSAAASGSSSTSGRARGSSPRRTSSTTAPGSPRPKCCAAASPAATTCTSFPTPPHGPSSRLGMRAMLGLPVLDFPTPYAADAGRLPASGARRPRRAEARIAARVLAVAACAVHGGRRDLGEDRRLRAPARPADPDASCRNGRRGRAKAARRTGSRRSRACTGWAPPVPVHRDPRRSPRAGRNRPARDRTAATSCTVRRRT